ncbi:MAG TPA: hypothetical protein VHD87_15110 [Acidimicrobiales bacterium]|nr:hypothetical protein [Acidimicrobiales bacterium]
MSPSAARRPRRRPFSAEACADALRAAARHAGSDTVSRSQYDTWRSAQPGPLPSSSAVIAAFGRWVDALKVAGLKVRNEQVHVRWTRKQRLDAITAAARAVKRSGVPFTRSAYMRWREEQPDPTTVPSAVEYSPEMWQDLCADAGIDAWARPNGEFITTEAVSRALRACFDETGSASRAAYRDWYAQLDPKRRFEAPYFDSIVSKFGTWRAACAAAGVPPGQGWPWTEEEALEALRVALADLPATPTQAAYRAWAETNAPAPSLWVLSRIFGSFGEAVTAARGR